MPELIINSINSIIKTCSVFITEKKVQTTSFKGNLEFFILLSIYKIENFLGLIKENIEKGNLLPAAYLARGLLENLFSINFYLEKLENFIVSNNKGNDDEVRISLLKDLRSYFCGTRDEEFLKSFEGRESPPKAINILTLQNKIKDPIIRKKTKMVYDALSELCHPNIGIHALFLNPINDESNDEVIVNNNPLNFHTKRAFNKFLCSNADYIFGFSENIVGRIIKVCKCLYIGQEVFIKS